MFKLSKADLAWRAEHRGHYPAAPRWYGVMTRCGQEWTVRRRLERELAGDGLEEVLVPEYRDPDGAEASMLFSSYIFLRCAMNDAIYLHATDDLDVYKILGVSWRIPSPIADDEMRQLKGVLSACEKPRVVRAAAVGEIVEIGSGLMRGMRGRVLGGNANHVRLQVQFTFQDPGAAVCVVVPRAMIKM
jgi:transcription antitermination factor NusG